MNGRLCAAITKRVVHSLCDWSLREAKITHEWH